MRKRTPLSIAAVMGVALVGCASGSEQSAAEAETQAPLDAMLEEAYAYGQLNDDEADAQFKRSQRVFDEVVSKCMAEQGFEYATGGDSGIMQFSTDEDLPQTLDEWIERASTVGYGLSDTGTGSTPNSGTVIAPASTEEDPNESIYQGLSPAEQEAYDKALHGDPLQVEATDEANVTAVADGEWDWTNAGCFGKAVREQEAVLDEKNSTTDVMNAPQWSELQQKIDALYQEEWDAEENGEIYVQYALCMDKRGYGNVKSPDAALNEASELVTQAGVWDTQTGKPDPDAHAKAKVEEINLAVADFTCQKETDVEGKRLAFRTKLQQAFVDENREELEAFVSALQAAGTQ